MRGKPHRCQWCATPMPGQDALYCSEECRKKMARERWMRRREEAGAPLECALCGTPLTDKQRAFKCRYCSRACWDRAKRGAPGWCEWCGAEMLPHIAKRQRTCSRQCHHDLRRDEWRRRAEAERISPDCAGCGALLTTERQLARGCCDACSRERWRKKREAALKRPPKLKPQATRSAWFARLPGGIHELTAMIKAIGDVETASRLGTTRSAVRGKLHRAGIRTRAAYAHRSALGLAGGNPMTTRRISHAHDSTERHAEILQHPHRLGNGRHPVW